MNEALVSLSEGLAGAVESAGSGVVRVEGRRRLPASGIVWSADGVIVTAHHTVEKDENIGIGLPDGKTATAQLAGRDPTTDIAVLRADVKGLHPLERAEAAALRVGNIVLAVGRPGQTVMATLGIVSALRPNWRTPAGGQLDHYLQTDAVMYPGFSGGALVDAQGRSVGLVSSGLVRGLSLAVPAASLKGIVETLLAHGRVRRGYLGVGAQPARLPGGLATQLGQETGLLLGSVESGSPADRGGLFMGDTIVALDGQAVKQMDDLLALLSGDRVGKDVPVRIVRGGQLLDLMVRIGEQR
jgi:S1-C subfamily serine protease